MSADIERLDAAIEHCAAHPEEHDQSEYARLTPCGTKLCLAGRALVQAGWRPVFHDQWAQTTDFEAPDGVVRSAGAAARDLLGLTEGEADRLFLAPDLETVRAVRDLIARRIGEVVTTGLLEDRAGI
jgi:hypothetical protein